MPTLRPEIDPDLFPALTAMPLTTDLDPELLAQVRPYAATSPVALDALLTQGRAVDRRDVTVPAPDGTRVPLTVLSPATPDRSTPAPCIYWVHGGGMVMGDRYSNLGMPLDWQDRFGAVIVTVDYRLAPEATGTTAVEDCYAGLSWTAEHAAELGIDPAKIVVAGTSAGGGLAAGAVLLSRDRGTPSVAAQLLVYPMLDHRNETVSSHQYGGEPGVWTREKNVFGWSSVLGDLPADGVPDAISPARAADLSGLPTTYVDAGSAEVFRDEDVTYASRIWAAGGQAELHVWAGGFHGFDELVPDAPVSVAARQARADWLGRVLASLS
jgi:acetyl esterase/lipase